jgi:hypothetical protein
MEEDEEDERDELPITIEFQPRKKQKLVMHKNETIMVRDKFQLKVQENAGKVLNMGYDKRCIVVPNVPIEQVKEVKTLPYGHVDTYKLHLAKTFKSMDIAQRICNLFVINFYNINTFLYTIPIHLQSHRSHPTYACCT